MTNSNTKEPCPTLDYNCVKEELLKMMDNPSHDDGSIGPILIRLAWHSSGTYDKESKTGRNVSKKKKPDHVYGLLLQIVRITK